MLLHPLEVIDSSPVLLFPLGAFASFWIISHTISILVLCVVLGVVRHIATEW
jgi:hypothetical protein